MGVSKMSAQSACSNMYINEKIVRTMGPSKVVTSVSAAAAYTQQLKILEDMSSSV